MLQPNKPPLDPNTKKLIPKRNLLYTKMKKTDCPQIGTKFLKLKAHIQNTLRVNYYEHGNTVIGSMTPTETVDPANQRVNTKKFYSFIKHPKKDQQGVAAPLKEHGITYSENLDKANILNQQFKSIFTPKSPLSLEQLAKLSMPGEPPPYSSMPDIEISTPGILKLLSNLKPGKAPGPDNIYPCVPKELRNEIAPVLNIIFSRSLTTKELPPEWLTANMWPPSTKKDMHLL